MFLPRVRARVPRLLGLVVSVVSSFAFAQSAVCTGALTRERLVACALERSPALAAQRAELAGAEGRKEAARPFLPSNPVLSGSVAARNTSSERATNWAVTLAQEVEIAGQSGLRVDVADEELQAQQAAMSVARAEVAEDAWRAWFEALAAKDRVELALRGERASEALAKTTAAMFANGLASEVDAAVAEATYASALRVRLDAERARAASGERLRVLLDAAEVNPEGTLEPLAWSGAPAERPEASSLRRLQRGAERRVELLRRTRIPNPTVSFTVQNDGFNERVLGVGLGLPVPLPQPLGRTNAGQLAEAQASVVKLAADVERLGRQLALEERLAKNDLERWTRARALYTPARVAQATRGLEAIAEQLRAARLSVREALTSQQALVEFLSAEVDAREQLCLASVRFVRAQGGSLEGGDL